jgi:hypothetical protein
MFKGLRYQVLGKEESLDKPRWEQLPAKRRIQIHVFGILSIAFAVFILWRTLLLIGCAFSVSSGIHWPEVRYLFVL